MLLHFTNSFQFTTKILNALVLILHVPINLKHESKDEVVGQTAIFS